MSVASNVECENERAAPAASQPKTIGNTETTIVSNTPAESVRWRSRIGEFGLLSLAAMTFAMLKGARGAEPNATILDDDRITYKDLDHGKFELVTKEAIPRHIIVDDPGETVVVKKIGSSTSVNQVDNSATRMEQLSKAQQEALANYEKGMGETGSSAPPFSDPGLLEPINFIQSNDTVVTQAALAPLSVFVFPPLEMPIVHQPPPPPPTLEITGFGGQIDVAANDIINVARADAGVVITGTTSGVEDARIVTVTIADSSGQVVYSGTAPVANNTWSINLSPAQAKTLADGMDTLTAVVTNAAGDSAQASHAIRVDETPPTIAIDTTVSNNVVNVKVAGAGFSIAGTTTDAENGQPVTVKIVDSSGHVVDTFTTTLTNNSWSVNVSSTEARLLHDGSYTVTADVSDSAGNPAPEATQAITVDETPPTVTWLPQAESGIEGTTIALGMVTTTVNTLPGHSNGVQSLVVSGIPVGAVLTDGTNDFIATSGSTSIDVKSWNLSNLKITPPNDTNFILTVTATDQDANTASASERVTVAPLAPDLDPLAAQGNEDTAIALDLGVTAKSLLGANGDASPNSLDKVVVSDIPVGATLSDGTGLPGHSFTATADSTSHDVASWNLSSLRITPPTEFEGSFTLTIAATEHDSEGDISATATATEVVIVAPVAEPPTARAPATLTLSEDATGVAVAGVSVGPLAEDNDDTVSATLTVSHGTLHVASLSGVTVTGNDCATLTLSGSAAAVNTLLAGLTYTPAEEYQGCDTLHLSVTSSDGSNTYPTQATAATAITVTENSESLIVGGPGPTLDWNDPANWSRGFVPTLGTDVTIDAPSNYTVIIKGTPDAQAASLTIPHGAASTDITISGILQLDGDLNVSQSGKLENDGTLEEATNATFIGPITNNGTIIVDPNLDLDVTGIITGIGKFWIDSGATLEFALGSKVAPGTTDSQIIYFEQGAGKLVIDDWGKFAGVITGTDIGTHLTTTDLIDLTQLPYVGGSMSVSVSYNSGTNISTMTFSDGISANNVTLHLSGNYTGTAWSFTSINGGAGTEISDPPTDSGTVTSGATGQMTAASVATTDFANAGGTNTSLVLDNSQNFAGQIVGFTGDGTAGTLSASQTFTRSPTKSAGGYGTFTMTAAGVWTYLLDTDNCAVQALDDGDKLTDHFTVTTIDGTEQVVTITIHGADDDDWHFEHSGTNLRATSDAPTVQAPTTHDTMAGTADSGQIIQASAAADATATLTGISASSNESSGNHADNTILSSQGGDSIAGGHWAHGLSGHSRDDHFAYLSPDQGADRFSAALSDFRSKSDRIDLTAFGAATFAILALDSTSSSVPAHTIAWIYDSAANQTIVYVNPTDQALTIGDSGLQEIHMQGFATIELSDFVFAPETVALVAAAEPDHLGWTATAHDDATVVAMTAADISSDTTLAADRKWSAETTPLVRDFDANRDGIASFDHPGLTSDDKVGKHSTQDTSDDAVRSAASAQQSIKPQPVLHTENAFAPNQTTTLDHAGPLTTGTGAVTAPSNATHSTGTTPSDAADDRAGSHPGKHGWQFHFTWNDEDHKALITKSDGSTNNADGGHFSVSDTHGNAHGTDAFFFESFSNSHVMSVAVGPGDASQFTHGVSGFDHGNAAGRIGPEAAPTAEASGQPSSDDIPDHTTSKFIPHVSHDLIV